MLNILLKVPIVLGTDWAWPARSNFTLLKNHVYLHRFCIFEIFVRHVCLTAPHPTWLRTHCLTTTCPPTGSRSRLWNCLAVYLGETIRVSASLDSAIGTQFYKLLPVFDILYTPHMPKFYMPTFGNRRNNSKTAPISLYLVRLSMLGKPGFASDRSIGQKLKVSTLQSYNPTPYSINAYTFMTNTAFNRSFLPPICVVIWIYFLYYSPWPVRIWRKKWLLWFPGVGRECSYRP